MKARAFSRWASLLSKIEMEGAEDPLFDLRVYFWEYFGGFWEAMLFEAPLGEGAS